MRLKDLRLQRFGPFTDLVLDLDAGDGDFHLIYGPNEAGKSTTRRAIMGLLFGIAETTLDDHVHKKPDLRIGARIDPATDGDRVIVRRKGRKATLLDDAGEPIPEDFLIRALGGVNKPLFETGFCLSHTSLIQGARDLLSGRGELGESLFGAGLGVRKIHALRTELKERARQVFSPSASKRPLNAAIKTFKDARKKVTQESLKPRGWHELNERLEEAEARLDTLAAEQSRVQAELTRLDRVKRILPGVKLREELLQKKNELGDVKLVDPASHEERKAAQQTLVTTTTSERKHLDEKAEIEAFIKTLDVPERLLARDEAIEALRDPLGAHKKAMIDRERLTVKTDITFQEMLMQLRSLKRDESLDEINRLRIDTLAASRIRTLMKNFARIDTALQKTKLDVGQAKKRVDECRRSLTSLPELRDPAALRQAIVSAHPWGDLDEQMRALRIDIDGDYEKAREQSLKLGFHQENDHASNPRDEKRREDERDDALLEKIAGLAVPLSETITRYKKAFHDLEKRGERLELKRAELDREQERVTRTLDSLESRGDVPSASDLSLGREARDARWQRIRAAWLLDTALDDSSPEAAAEDYESKVRDADRLADLLWSDADRTARHAALLKDRDRLDQARKDVTRQAEQIGEETKALSIEWRETWKSTGIDPLSPEEMLEWKARRQKLLDTLERWTKKRHEMEKLAARSDEFRKRCESAFASLGEPLPGAEESHMPLLQRAEDLLDRIEREERTHAQAVGDSEKAGKALCEREQALAICTEEMDRWRSNWEKAVRCIGLDVTATVEEAEALLDELDDLFTKADRYEQDRRRLDHIRADAERFDETVKTLVRECAPHLERYPPEEAASNLIAKLRSARDALKDRKNGEERLRNIARELNELKRDRESAQATIDGLMKAAGCDSLEALEAAEEKSARYRSIEDRLANTEEQLLAEGVGIDVLVEQAGAADPDTIDTLIEKAIERNESLKKDLADQNEACGRLKEQRQSMDGTSRAAEAAAEAEEALASISHHARTYGALRLASRLLEMEIERFRRENQDPLLSRAGAFFRIITLEAFKGFATGFNAADEPILLCVRANDDQVPVEGLSEGTRDQLYLSLRLAGVDLHLKRNEPVPLVIDDALINFDDARAEAVLKVLGELSKRTQILFFTHHDRIREIAKLALPENRLVEHTLLAPERTADAE